MATIPKGLNTGTAVKQFPQIIAYCTFLHLDKVHIFITKVFPAQMQSCAQKNAALSQSRLFLETLACHPFSQQIEAYVCVC